MTPALARLARRVAADRSLGVDVVVTLPTGDVLCRGTWSPEDEVLDTANAERIVRNARIRIPTGELPSRPSVGARVVVGGKAFFVAEVLDKTVTIVLELTEWSSR